MKRIIAFVLFLGVIMSCAVPALAEESCANYYIEELKMSLSFPTGYVAFTRSVPEDDPNLKLYNLSQDGLIEFFALHGICFDAWDRGVKHELVITATESKYENLSELSGDGLARVENSVIKPYADSGYEIQSTEYAEVNGLTYFVLRTRLDDRAKDSVLQYFTVYNGNAITFAWHSYREPVGSYDEEIMSTVMGSVSFADGI